MEVGIPFSRLKIFHTPPENYMKYFILFFVLTFTWNHSLSAQSKTDTLELELVHKMTTLADLYSPPGENYQLDHFVVFISQPGIDPFAAYNYSSDFIPNTIENLNRLTSGSTLSLQVYAVNSDHPGEKPVKLPRKDFYIK